MGKQDKICDNIFQFNSIPSLFFIFWFKNCWSLISTAQLIMSNNYRICSTTPCHKNDWRPTSLQEQKFIPNIRLTLQNRDHNRHRWYRVDYIIHFCLPSYGRMISHFIAPVSSNPVPTILCLLAVLQLFELKIALLPSLIWQGQIQTCMIWTFTNSSSHKARQH